MWGEVLGADQDDGEACNPACGLEASDEASFVPRMFNRRKRLHCSIKTAERTC